MVSMTSSTRSLGLVALSLAALSPPGKMIATVSGFGIVHPVTTTLPAPPHSQHALPVVMHSRTSLHMSSSLSHPEDGPSSGSGRDKRTSGGPENSNGGHHPNGGDGGLNHPSDMDPSSSSGLRRTPAEEVDRGYDGLDGAFPLPDEMEVPETRQLRWEREKLVQSKFATGDDVVELRETVSSLREELVDVRRRIEDDDDGSVTMSDGERRAARGRVKELERKILELKGRDAEFAYAVSSELLEKARAAGDDKELVKKYTVQVEEARLCVPQLNMHGLWVGKYGEHGYEMINITYSGDVLVATKVTGDRNVPKGKVTFTVDLSSRIRSSSSSGSGSSVDSSSSSSMASSYLEPIELNPKASKQWGKKYLPRHAGKGRVASENFANAQWMEGQLILVGRFFSFAWVPIGHQVFFGRPSAELTIKMMREAREEELRKDHVAVMRDAATMMLDETYWAEREADSYDEEGCFE